MTTSREIIENANLYVVVKHGDETTGWAMRHSRAWGKAIAGHVFPGSSIVLLIKAAASYADAHRARFESYIGEDYVLGKAWAKLLHGTLLLLDGETGTLDCGTLDGMIRELAKFNHVDPDTFDCGYSREGSGHA